MLFCVCPPGQCDNDPRYVTEGEFHNELTDRVECDWGYEGCHGDAMVADMFRLEEGWMCPICHAIARAEFEEDQQAAMYGWSYG